MSCKTVVQLANENRYRFPLTKLQLVADTSVTLGVGKCSTNATAMPITYKFYFIFTDHQWHSVVLSRQKDKGIESHLKLRTGADE